MPALPLRVEYRDVRHLPRPDVLELYRANRWSAAQRPDELMAGLASSHSLISAWYDGHVVGLGNAISDGHLVVYYPHLLVHPQHQRRGIGKQLMLRLRRPYEHFHQQVLLADRGAPEFYEKLGFRRASSTEPMWIYSSPP